MVAALTSRWYAPDLYDELQFFSMVTAAEAFERIRLRKQDVNFKRALQTLAGLAGPPFQSVGWRRRRMGEARRTDTERPCCSPRIAR